MNLVISGHTQEDGEKADVLLCRIRDSLREDLLPSVAGWIDTWSRPISCDSWTGTVDASH